MSTLSQKSETVVPAQKSATVAEFRRCLNLSRRFRRQSLLCDGLTFLRQIVALFCDSVDRL